MYCFKNTKQIVQLSVDLTVILLKGKDFLSVVVAVFPRFTIGNKKWLNQCSS